MKYNVIIRKILTFCMAATLVFGCMPGITLNVEAAGKASLNAKKITIAKGMSYKLKVKNKGSSVKWSSTDRKVAKVTRTGKVTGVKNGKATIKAVIRKNGKKKVLKCNVTVKTPAFTKANYSVDIGDSLTLAIKNKYKKSSYKWKSSDASVVKVNSKGVITGISEGNATISCTIKIPKKGSRLKKTLTIKTKVTVSAVGDEDEQEVSAPEDLASEAPVEDPETDTLSGGQSGDSGGVPAGGSGRNNAPAARSAAAGGKKTAGSWDFVRCEWNEYTLKVDKFDETCKEAILVSEAGTNWTNGNTYVLDKTYTQEERIEVKGYVNLILTDGNTLYADGGIKIGGMTTLNIYGQDPDYSVCGKLIANRNKVSGVGIGTASADDAGGFLNVHGGNIAAYGGKNDAGIGSGDKKDCIDITVYAGKVKGVGGESAAGIGDGRGVANSGDINLYGGNVSATGGHYAAGIGGGNRVNGKGGHHNGTIRIYDCKVTAYGGDDGAGIGGGEGGHCGNIIIYGSDATSPFQGVLAHGGNNGAGIGGGECESTGDGGTISILGNSFVEAYGGGDGAGIGGGDDGHPDRIEIRCDTGDTDKTGGIVKARGGNNAAGIGGGNDANSNSKGTNKETGEPNGIFISGGKIYAYGKDGAGIGGGEGGDGVNINITDGEVYAYGGGNKQFNGTGNGAGIGGGGHGGDGGTITIGGGTIHAESVYGAGIGGGRAKEANDRSGKGGNITITDGDVTAIAFTFGIGCGSSEQDDIDLHRLTMNSIGHFVMTGGVVKAYGKAAGIGARNGIFEMCGGELTADGRGKGAGMWFTYDRDDHDIAHIYFKGGTSHIVGYKEGGLMTGSDAEEGNFNEITISGPETYVYVSCTGEESCIGGRRMGPIVKIRDFATVNVKKKSDWSKSIGGHYGLFPTGTCSVYPEAQVILANRSNTPVPKGERNDACHYKNNVYDLWVKPCDHPGPESYNVSKDGLFHCRTCKYCKTDFKEEIHQYDQPGDVTCSVCGHVSTDPQYTVTLNAGDGSGDEESFSVVPYYEYTLPDCEFTPPAEPEGLAFYRWRVQFGDAVETEELKPGDKIRISNNTKLTALWKEPCKVTFKTGEEESEPFTDEVVYGYPVEDPGRPVRDGYAFKYWRLESDSPDTPYDFENSRIEEDITLVAEWSDQPVTISSMGTLTDSSGAVTEGAASVEVWPDTVVAPGTEVTLTATMSKKDKEVYDFRGWYTFTSTPENGPFVTIGDILAGESEGLSYSMTADENYTDVKIAAVFSLKENPDTLLILDYEMGASHGYATVDGGMPRILEDKRMGFNVPVNEPVILDVHSDPGYWPERIYYTYDYYYPGSDTPITSGREVYPDSDGKYVIYPPAADITLYATFANQEYTLAAYTSDTGCLGSPGNITISPAKDTYRVNDKVTVTAEEVEGYDFMGWYPVTDVTDGQVSAYDQESILCKDLAYQFEFGNSDEDIAAVYRAKDGSALVKVEPVNGAEFRAKGFIGNNGDTGETYDHTRQFVVPISDTLKLTAGDPDSVLHWENESHKILGSSAALDHYVTSNTTISLVYKTGISKKTYLQFVTDYGQVLSYQLVTDQGDIVYPTIPTKVGYRFENWVFEGTDYEATEEDIWARTGDQKLITVVPQYEKDDTACKLTVNHMAGGKNSKTDTYDQIIGDTRTLSAAKIDGFTFHHWEDHDGQILGYTKNYFVKCLGDMDINACYEPVGTANEDVEPVITMSNLMAIAAGDTHKVYGFATRSIPEGYTLIEHGVLYAYDSSVPEGEFVYSDGSDGIKRYISTGKGMIGTVGLNALVYTDDQKVSMRGYMLLRDKAGEETYYFTNIVYGTYGSLE